MCIGDLVLWWHVLLHSLAGTPHSQQDERVGQKDDGAGHGVTEEEEADYVAHRCRILAGTMPVYATCCPVRLRPIISPSGERTYSKHSSVAPDDSNQQASMVVWELVACKRRGERRKTCNTITKKNSVVHDKKNSVVTGRSWKITRY